MKEMGIGEACTLSPTTARASIPAARVWWTFRAWAHEEVRVLNGGLKKWKAEGRALEDGAPRRRGEAPLQATLNADLVRDVGDVQG